MSPSLPEDAIVFLNGDGSWWMSASSGWEHDRNFGSPLTFDASESGLFNGNFVPPPPRPPFLDEFAQSDGLTTCGMCAWATKIDPRLTSNSTIDVPGKWSFSVVIVVVSLISALIGAFVMVSLLRCRKLKAGGASSASAVPWRASTSGSPVATGHAQRPSTLPKHGADAIRVPHPSSGVWTWLGQRRASSGPDPLSQPSSSPAENHYTHMDDCAYNAESGEALYAELDRESLQSGNPSYQNTAYSGEVDKELHVFSSAPSSAYYSDLSVTTSTAAPERTYETVGGVAMNQNCCPLLEQPLSDQQTQFDLNVLSPAHTSTALGRRHHRLSAINEGVSGQHLQPDFV